MKIDIVYGGSFGDEAKKKVCKWLLGKNNYTHSCRANGGPNAGGTLYHNGQKYILNHLPSGIFHGIVSLMCSGCVIYPKRFLEEIENLERNGINTTNLIKISSNAHIITDKHIEEDIKTDKIGSTRKGIMPVYRDKYARCGIRAENCSELKEFICDQYEELMREENYILTEGVQGMLLDIDHSPNYPYITSCPTSPAYLVHSMGLPMQKVDRVYCVTKCYDTYVGTMKDFQPKGEIFQQLAKVGKETGCVSGRTRFTNYLNLPQLIKSVKMNGATDVIMNKMDVLREIGEWKVLVRNNAALYLATEENFKKFIRDSLPREVNVMFSDKPEEV